MNMASLTSVTAQNYAGVSPYRANKTGQQQQNSVFAQLNALQKNGQTSQTSQLSVPQDIDDTADSKSLQFAQSAETEKTSSSLTGSPSRGSLVDITA